MADAIWARSPTPRADTPSDAPRETARPRSSCFVRSAAVRRSAHRSRQRPAARLPWPSRRAAMSRRSPGSVGAALLRSRGRLYWAWFVLKIDSERTAVAAPLLHKSDALVALAYAGAGQHSVGVHPPCSSRATACRYVHRRLPDQFSRRQRALRDSGAPILPRFYDCRMRGVDRSARVGYRQTSTSGRQCFDHAPVSMRLVEACPDQQLCVAAIEWGSGD